MEKLVARQQSCLHGLTAPSTVCNCAAPYQAHVEIQLEPYLTVLRTVRPDSGKAAFVSHLFLNFFRLRHDVLLFKHASLCQTGSI